MLENFCIYIFVSPFGLSFRVEGFTRIHQSLKGQRDGFSAEATHSLTHAPDLVFTPAWGNRGGADKPTTAAALLSAYGEEKVVNRKGDEQMAEKKNGVN